MADNVPDNEVVASTPPTTPDTGGSGDTGGSPTIGLDLQAGKIIPRKQVRSWALWDWAAQPFNSVILSFVFVAIYLVGPNFLGPEIAALPQDDPAYTAGIARLSSALGWAITAAGALIFLLAPVLGQRADVSGRRKFWLAIYTGLLVLSMAALFFVQGAPAFFVLGISLVALGIVFSEIAGVNYNAMLVQVSTPRTVGAISGLGWGLGYLGGIVALVLIVVSDQVFGWYGLPTENGLIYRVIAVGCALWTIVFSLPIFLNVPEIPAAAKRERVSFFRSYAVLVNDIVALFRESRHTFWFLIASAVYRDGLAGVFAFGAIIATGTFQFSATEVLVFGIAANLIAGVSTIVSGRVDDRFGPRAVVLFSLTGLVAAGLGVFLLHDEGKTVFWIGGLLLTIFVGPAQAASRSLLARVTPAGRESEIFGLWATTGRAASFISPLLWSSLIAITGAQYWGILGLVLVLAVGLVLILLVKLPELRPGHERHDPAG
ncbi:MAG: MFS transporter [Rhodoglobus sp.]